MPEPASTRNGLMAVSAKIGNMTIVTRNTSDITRSSARLLNSSDSSA